MKNIKRNISDPSISSLKKAIKNREKPRTMLVSRLGDTLHLTAKRGKNSWRSWRDDSGNSFRTLDQALNQIPQSVDIEAEVIYDSPDLWRVFCEGRSYSSLEYDSLEQLLNTTLKGKRVHLAGESIRSESLSWNMHVHRDLGTDEKLCGSGRERLKKALQEQNFHMDCECDELKVLVCVSLDFDKRTEFEKIPSSWIVVDPGDPFVAYSEEVSFPKMEINLSPAEAKACDETRLAFLYQGNLWAIRNAAKKVFQISSS